MGIIDNVPTSGHVLKSNTFLLFTVIEPHRIGVCADFGKILG